VLLRHFENIEVEGADVSNFCELIYERKCMRELTISFDSADALIDMLDYLSVMKDLQRLKITAKKI